MKQSSFIKINPADSVVVCLRPFKKGEVINIDGKDIVVLQDTPAGHKILIKDAPEGEDIVKYGYPIGHAKENLKAGQWVNEHNLKTNLAGTLKYEYNPVDATLDIPKEDRTFKGFVRKNGDVGTRNEIWIVPTVGCVNGIGEQLVRRLTEETHLRVEIGNERLYPAYLHRIALTVQHTMALALLLMRAHTPADGRQVGGLVDDLHGLTEIALRQLMVKLPDMVGNRTSLLTLRHLAL